MPLLCSLHLVDRTNAPLPLHVCRDGHVPDGEAETFRNPDLTRVVDGEKSAGGQVLVDQHSKQMY